VGEAEHLPLADASVDLLTISFGLRNTTHLAMALDARSAACSNPAGALCAWNSPPGPLAGAVLRPVFALGHPAPGRSGGG
jgi:hypothetical protein